MNKPVKPRFKMKPLALAVAVGIAQLPQLTSAADWTLADAPLYLGSGVPANLVFLVDDSGSMDWEIMSKDLNHDGLFTNSQPDGTSAAGDGGIQNRPGCTVSSGSFYGYLYGVEFGKNSYTDGNDDCNTAADNEWRFRNYDYNHFYFNPKKEYKPWAGTDSGGVAFGDVDVTMAWENPNVKNYVGGTEWIDLTTKASSWAGGTGDSHDPLAGGFRFYTWSDNDADGKFDNGEQTEYQIGNLTAGQVQADWFGANAPDPVAAVKTNFANWFSYYRKRMLVAKSAFGKVVANVDNMYMALATLHNHANVNTSLRLVDGTVAGQANRKTLLDAIYRMEANQGTPLQNAMKQVGKYLANQTNSHFAKKTPLTKENGGECQQNFTLVMTDGFYNGAYSDTNPKIGNADADGVGDWDGGDYADAYTGTLADIAMYYYESDLDSTNAPGVPVIPGVDTNKDQHMVTYSIAFGVNGNLSAMPDGDPATKFTWPNPALSDKNKIDDLRHAAYNGRGEFLEAGDPDELVNSLNYMMNSILERTAASAGLAFNSTTVRSNTLVFQGRYNTADWIGELRYMPIRADGSIGAAVVSTAVVLENSQTPSNRAIITYDTDTGKGVPFQWTDLGATWKTALGNDPRVLDFLRGDHSCETKSEAACTGAKIFRDRRVRLGDIVNSAPAYIDKPNAFYTDADYATFRADQANRTPVVYVGANDGMLHGFNADVNADGSKKADTGKEVIAYVPSAVAGRMKALSDPLYSHQYLVDGSPAVGDAKFDGGWHTVLVSGLRAGGQAMVALDVTNPGTFAESKADDLLLWEFTDKNDPDLGYTFADPTIARLADGKFYAIFGNGYNSTVADGNVGSGNAVLFIVDIGTGVAKKIDTTYGRAKDPDCAASCATNGRPNGLSSPAVVDLDGDLVTDFVYAGDLFGNVWRFDLTSADSANWAVSFGGQPLFAARTPDGKSQSITSRPQVGWHPESDGYMVYFGTGKYFEADDIIAAGQRTQTFYGLWDKACKPTAKCTPPAFSAFTRANLLSQKILTETETLRITTDPADGAAYAIDWNTHRGWYLDLIYGADNKGERVITESILRPGKIVFTTMLPQSGVCQFGGSGWLMELDSADGSRLGLPPFDINGDGKFNSADMYNGYVPSGAKSQHGIPSAPAIISAGGGVVEYIFMNFTDGALGGTGIESSQSSTDSAYTYNGEGGGGADDDELPVFGNENQKATSDSTTSGVLGVQGRLNWQRLR